MLSDIMIDLETLATSPNAAVLTIGVVKFDPFNSDIDNPTCEKLYIKVDLDSCDELKLEVNDDTIAWWGQQSKEAQDEAFSPEGRVHIREAFNQLYKFCWGAKRVWSHGASFDTVICENIFRKLNKACPWKFWEVRCTRTLFDIGIDPQRPPVLKHHALEDAWNQTIGVQNVFQRLRSSTQFNGNLISPFANQK
jgi:DNA polymerase III epsilon subunit-like protein